MNPEDIGAKIRNFRKMKGMTQEKLANLAGISTMSIRRYESGERIVTEETRQRIADALLISVRDLMDESSYGLGFREGSEAEEWLNRQIDELWAQEGYTHSERECSLINAFSQLNDEGQQKAVDSVEIIAGNPRYRAETAPESTQAPTEDK